MKGAETGRVGRGSRSGKALEGVTFRPVAGCRVRCMLGTTRERGEGGDAGMTGELMQAGLGEGARLLVLSHGGKADPWHPLGGSYWIYLCRDLRGKAISCRGVGKGRMWARASGQGGKPMQDLGDGTWRWFVPPAHAVLCEGWLRCCHPPPHRGPAGPREI